MALINCPECGKEVSSAAESCPNCGYSVKKHFDDIKNTELEMQRQALLAVQKQQRSKTLKIALSIMVVVAATLTAFIINHSIMSQRMSFSNDTAMLEYLTDYTCWELDSDYREEYLVFYNDNLCSKLNDVTDDGRKIILHPKRGYFKRGNDKYIISSSGDIVSSDNEYCYKPSYATCPFEDGYLALDIEVLSHELNNGHFSAKYKVINTGNKSYDFVELESVVTLSDGKQIALNDVACVVPDDYKDKKEIYLRPNKTGSTMATSDNIPDNVEELSVHIKNYDTEFKITPYH